MEASPPWLDGLIAFSFGVGCKVNATPWRVPRAGIVMMFSVTPVITHAFVMKGPFSSVMLLPTIEQQAERTVRRIEFARPNRAGNSEPKDSGDTQTNPSLDRDLLLAELSRIGANPKDLQRNRPAASEARMPPQPHRRSPSANPTAPGGLQGWRKCEARGARNSSPPGDQTSSQGAA